MKIDCDHFEDCGRADGGCCRHPTPPFGAQPSFGGCNRCGHNRSRGQRIDLGAVLARSVRTRTPEEIAAAKAERDEICRGLWRDLHGRAAGLAGIDLLAELAWLTDWSARVPCGDCRLRWLAGWDAHPADLASPARYFAWTVMAHNATNAETGKPQMALADALRLYDAPPAWQDELRTAFDRRSADN